MTTIGGRTTSIVGPSPKSTSEKPTAADAGPRVGSGTTTPSMVIVTVEGPVVGSRSTRWPSADSDRSSSVTCWGARPSTAIVTAPRWRTAAAPCGWCSVTWSMGSATWNRMRWPSAGARSATSQAVVGSPSTAMKGRSSGR